MKFDLEHLPGYVDVTSVAETTAQQDVQFTMELAKAYNCAAAIVNPCWFPQLMKCRGERKDIRCGTTAAFPFGCDLTSVKLYSCQQAVLLGAEELDVVMNVGAFLSGDLETVKRELTLLAQTLTVPVKVIIETALLSDEQIVEAAVLAADCGVHYIKTSTGFYDPKVTPGQVHMIHEAVGSKAKIKASGGIRTLAEAEDFLDAGASRLGIGAKSAYGIFQELDRKLDRSTPQLGE